MGVVVFADASNGKIVKPALEAVYYASKIDANTTVVTYGATSADELAKLGNYGAKKVIVNRSFDSVDSGKLTKLVCETALAENADVIVFAQDPTGKAVAPRVSAKLDAGHVAGAISLPDTSNGFVVKKNVFSGKAFAHYEIKTAKKVISLLPNSLKPVISDASAEVLEQNTDLGDARVKVIEVKKTEGVLSLPEAEIVVSAGRGLKGPENWGMIEELATELGAATACSRPVSDIGWRPHHEHVGQTGIAIRPNLYIAVGISGAIQHLAGVNGSKVMVVINTDAEAPFFKAADYGIVGDAFDVVPRLIEAVKVFNANK
ncbi:MAG: electron transfer flavoprotein alpha subunit [Flavobacteriales bacterium]|jgi:electron transfer flavoprotein alpha subunit